MRPYRGPICRTIISQSPRHHIVMEGFADGHTAVEVVTKNKSETYISVYMESLL